MILEIICIWVSLEASAALSAPDQLKLPEEINFKVSFEDSYEEIDVALKPVKTFLAGKNVPVWIVREENHETLEPLPHVMQQIGPFSPYWDQKTCSAALHFHKTNKLEGTVGHHHVLHELTYNPMKKRIEPSEDTLMVSPMLKHERKLTEAKKSPKREDEAQDIGVKSLHDFPDTVYIETLVIVNHDITEDFHSNYAAIVVYLLTSFNTVDLLYSAIEEPFIKINIAGIIIGNTRMSFPKLEKCYQTIVNEDKSTDGEALYISCSFSGLRKTLKKFHLPSESYDIVVFLTRSPLSTEKDGITSKEKDDVFGVSRSPDPEGDGYRRSSKDIGVSLVSEPKNLERFHAVAHEMAHLLGVPHDGGLLWGRDGGCTANLMRSRMSCCKECLKFGGKSPEFLKIFFGTRDSCRFHNEPRSLHDPPGPRLFWKSVDQCKCYGFPGVYNPPCVPHLMPAESECISPLRCRSKEGKIRKTDYHMNGTPCKWLDKNIATHVCWDRECVPIQNEDELPDMVGDLHISES